MKKLRKTLVGVFVVASVAGGAFAQHLSIESYSSDFEHPNRPLSKTFNGSGMSGDSGAADAFTTDTHSTDVHNDIGLWVSTTPPVFIEYDLGQSFALSNLIIWNDNEPNWWKQGIKGATIEVRELGGASEVVFQGDIPRAPALGEEATTASLEVDLGDKPGRFIRITTDEMPNHSWRYDTDGTATDKAVGFSEIRVYGDPTGLGNTNTTEACCLYDGTCTPMEAADCLAADGSPQGSGSECITTQCPEPTQACCYDDGTCADLDPNICTSEGGTPGGFLTTCATSACPQPEACCFNNGSCEDLLPSICAATNGVPQGIFTSCEISPCPQLEACCMPDDTCQDLLADLCTAAGGTPLGTDSACFYADCVGATTAVVSGAVEVEIEDRLLLTYDLERSENLPDTNSWSAVSPSYVIGDGGSALLIDDASAVDDGSEPNPASYRFSSNAQGAAVGGPSAANNWDTTSAVSARGSNEKTCCPSRGFINLINGSGIDETGTYHTDDLFGPGGVDGTTMGFNQNPIGPDRGGTVTGSYWFEFGFDQPYEIADILIWNYNEDAGGDAPGPNPTVNWTQQGIQEITIQYTTVDGDDEWGSTDEADWTTADMNTIAGGPIAMTMGSGSNLLEAEPVPLNATAKYIVITGADNPNGNFMDETCCPDTASVEGAMSEIRFTLASQPEPPAMRGIALGEHTGFTFTSIAGTVYKLERAAKVARDLPVGNPTEANGWDTRSKVSVDHQSGEADSRVALNSIDGTGISGMLGEYHAGGNPTDTMYLSRDEGQVEDSGSDQNAGQTPGRHYITYAFDKVYTLNEIWVWNWNESAYLMLGWKNLEVQVSTTNGSDPSDWTTVYSGPIDQATGLSMEPVTLTIPLPEGVEAQYVALINTGLTDEDVNHGGGTYPNDSGLAEVRFFEAGDGVPTISGAIFKATGARTVGDGGTQVLYDPDGYSDEYWYRVLPE